MQKQDWILLAICIGLAWAAPSIGDPVIACIETTLGRLGRNKFATLFCIASATILIRLALLPWMGVPHPQVHDEFSYLLAADTFAHGRLTNPPHPLWIFFDTFHVLQHPTYASMYPPAQGMVLAIGQLLGNPWIGVLLSTAAMCVAFVWMLQGWVPPEWALLGGVLVLARFGIFSSWMNSYWGGSVAATAAALVLGALPRILNREQALGAVLFGIGAGILAISRPLEGCVFCIPLVLALLWWTLRSGPEARISICKRVLLPLAAIVACFVGFVGYYNWRVTGIPTVFPHMIEDRAYNTSPVFLWEGDKPRKTYANPQFDDFYNRWVPDLYQRSWEAAKGQFWWKAGEFWQFFLGPALTLPFLALPWILAGRLNRLLLIQLVISGAGLWVVVYFHPHYAAPLMAAVFVLLVQCMRNMRAWKIGNHRIGVGLTRIATMYTLLIGPAYFANMLMSGTNPLFVRFHPNSMALLWVTVIVLGLFRLGAERVARSAGRSRVVGACEFVLLSAILSQICLMQSHRHPDDFQMQDEVNDAFRKTVEQKLDALPGQHLVLVRYSAHHDSANEYVYNRADIDDAKIVWAREIPGMDLSPLLQYFHNRDIWEYEPDVNDSDAFPYVPRNPAYGQTK